MPSAFCNIREPAARCRSSRRRCLWHRRPRRRRPGRTHRRYRRSRWFRRDRCRRERRPCGRPLPPSGRCPWSSCRLWAALPAGYISCTSMPACFFSRSIREQGPLIWLPIQAGTPSHLSPALPRYCDGTINVAVLLDQRLDYVVHRLKQISLRVRPPGRHREDVMAGLRLGLGGDRYLVLPAVACDVVDRNFDLLLGGPLVDQIGTGLVGSGYPVIPEAHRELAGRVSASNVRRRDQRRG